MPGEEKVIWCMGRAGTKAKCCRDELGEWSRSRALGPGENWCDWVLLEV